MADRPQCQRPSGLAGTIACFQFPPELPAREPGAPEREALPPRTASPSFLRSPRPQTPPSSATGPPFPSTRQATPPGLALFSTGALCCFSAHTHPCSLLTTPLP